MAKAVFCTVKTQGHAIQICDRLKAASFLSSDISVLMADKMGTKDFMVSNQTQAAEGGATGAGTGASVGGGLGWLAGIGDVAIPGVGPFIAAGPIMATLTGAAVGGGPGGITGALVGMGMPEDEARRYEEKVKAGSSLISVHSEDSAETERAQEILESSGAEDISTSAEAVLSTGS